MELNPNYIISKISLVNKFLMGLGLDYNIFLTSFYQKHSLLLEQNEKNKIIRAGVTFNKAV